LTTGGRRAASRLRRAPCVGSNLWRAGSFHLQRQRLSLAPQGERENAASMGRTGRKGGRTAEFGAVFVWFQRILAMTAGKQLKGWMTALVTPFRDGAVDEAAFRSLVSWQIEQGIQGLVPVGTTGESPTLSHDEHRRVVEMCIAEA